MHRNTVLVHAPVGRDAELMVASLLSAGVLAASEPSFPALLEAGKDGRVGALLLTGEALTVAATRALSEALSHQPHWSDLPVLVLVPGGRESSLITHMESALSTLPNLTLLERPIRPATLASVARNALRSRYRQYEVQRVMEEQEAAAAVIMQTEKLAAVGRLASTIAHEINNPLEAVTNLLYLCRTSTDDPLLTSYVSTAEIELRRVAAITSQTLRFHKQATRASEVTCTDLFSNALMIFQSRIQNASIRVEKRKRADRPVMCMEGEIGQVLNNLIGNAIDAMKNGGRLLVRSAESTQWRAGIKGLRLTVADTGSGMSRETLGHLFQAFYTTKGINGTGLGLWVSREIVQRHGGSLLVRSSNTAGRSGTVFSLFLPFEPGLPAA